MKRIILASTLALSAQAGVAKPDNTQLLSHVDKELSELSDSGLNKRAFSSPAAAFARSYGRYNPASYNKRSWSGTPSEYDQVMKSTITQLKNNLNLLEQKTKGLPDKYVAGLISRLGATSRATMGRLCKSGEVESRMCGLIQVSLEDDMNKRSGIFSPTGMGAYHSMPGQFIMKRSLAHFDNSPMSHDEELFLKRSMLDNEDSNDNLYEESMRPSGDDFVYQQKRDGSASSPHAKPQYSNYNSFQGGDSINWGSLPGFGAKSAFNMPSKRSVDASYAQQMKKNANQDYSEILGSLLAKFGPKNDFNAGRSLL